MKKKFDLPKAFLGKYATPPAKFWQTKAEHFKEEMPKIAKYYNLSYL